MYKGKGHRKNRDSRNADSVVVEQILNKIEPFVITNGSFDRYVNLETMIKDNKRFNKHNKYVKNKTVVMKSSTIATLPLNDVYTCESNFDVLKHLFQNVKENCVIKTDKNGKKDKICKKMTTHEMNSMMEHVKPSSATDTLVFQKYKIEFCDLVTNNNSVIKSLNLNPAKIYEKLLDKNNKQNKTNNYNFDTDLFFVLMKIMKINFIYISHKCSFVINDDFNDAYYIIIGNTDSSLKQNSYLNKCVFKQYELSSNCYSVIASNESVFNDVYMQIVENTLVIDDLKKPIKSITYYKVKDLQTMALKLGISINKSDGKAKTKQLLYDAISNKITTFI